MTEYGRGPGSEPWHPEDPLYGDQGWGGRQAAHGQGQYEGQQQPYAQDPYAQQGYQQDPYSAAASSTVRSRTRTSSRTPRPAAAARPRTTRMPSRTRTPSSQQPAAAVRRRLGHRPAGGDAVRGAAAPVRATARGYGEQADHYGTPEAYPPPQPPGHREEARAQQSPDWDPDVPEEETHPFFTGADDPADTRDRAPGPVPGTDDEYDDDPRESRRGGGERRGKGKKKNRNGCACLGVAAVLVGGLGGVGYFGYSYYQSQFGEAPGLRGHRHGPVEVEIPEGRPRQRDREHPEEGGRRQVRRCLRLGAERESQGGVHSGRRLYPEEGDVRRQRHRL